jgi:hypothetical protein
MSADVSNSAAAADGADVSNSAAAADITLNTGAIQKQCATCNALENKLVNKFKTCSKCMNVWYCSLECQKNDWKKHKPICTQYCKWVVSLEKHIELKRLLVGTKRTQMISTTMLKWNQWRFLPTLQKCHLCLAQNILGPLFLINQTKVRVVYKSC